MTKTTEKVPYLRSFMHRFSSHTSQVLEKLTQTHGLYQEQLLTKMIHDYAQQHLTKADLDELEVVNKKYTLPVSQFFPDRQLAVFDDCLSSDQVSALLDLPMIVEDGQTRIHLQDNESLHKDIRYLIARVTQSYYCEMEGFFPSYFEEVEGYYLETRSPSDTEFYNDASKDNLRQLSIFIVLSGYTTEFRLAGSEDNMVVTLRLGKVLVLPSNFSSSYQIAGTDGDVTFLKAYRCD